MSKEVQPPPFGPILELHAPLQSQECLGPAPLVPAIRPRPLARRSAPAAILFEEQNGIFWLRGKHLDRAKAPLGLRCESPAIGFDRVNWAVSVAALAKKRIPIGVVSGNTIAPVHFQAPEKPAQLPSIALDLRPEQLVGQQEIDRLASELTRKHSRLAELVGAIRAQAQDDRNAWTDPGTLYAYQVADDLYEVDWDLTGISLPAVEALLLAAHLEGQPLPCQLVPPKPRRAQPAGRSRPRIQISEPIPYGQLRLPLESPGG